MKPVLCWVLERPLLQDMGLCHALQQLWPAHAVACTAPHDSPHDSPHNWPASWPPGQPELLLVDATRPPQALPALVQRLRQHWPQTPVVLVDAPGWDEENLADACVPGGLTLHGLAQRLREVADELHHHFADRPPTAWVETWEVACADAWAQSDSHWLDIPNARTASEPAETSPQACAAPVTRREQQIIALLARGLSARVVAQRLFISEGTVRKHRENLRTKLDLRTTAELAVWAARQGYVTEPERGC